MENFSINLFDPPPLQFHFLSTIPYSSCKTEDAIFLLIKIIKSIINGFCTHLLKISVFRGNSCTNFYGVVMGR